jgi:hypothetical protein
MVRKVILLSDNAFVPETNLCRRFYALRLPESERSMSDETIFLRLLVRTILLAWFTVVGLTSFLCDSMSCGCRILCAMAGMTCGAILFLQIACAQIARYYQHELENQSSSRA